MKIVDAVVVLHTPEVVQSFPPIWAKLPKSKKEENSFDATAAHHGIPLDHLIRDMDESGVDTALMAAPNSGPWGIIRPPESVIDAVNSYPQQFVAGGLGVNPYNGMAELRKFESYVKNNGFKAMHLYPHWLDLAPNNAIYYPFYAKCVELDIPVYIQIHLASQSFLRSHGRPQYIEDVLASFPQLRVVGLHVGWPWIKEFVALLIKHPNFYMTTSVYPTHAWDANFIRFATHEGQDKLIFASSAPMVKGGIREAVAGIDTLELPERVRMKIFQANASKVFKL